MMKLNPIKNYITTRIDKKSLIYLAIIILAFFLAIILIWYFSRIPAVPEKLVPEKSEQERMIEQQLEELEKLRAETQPLTEEETKAQLKELEKLRQKTKPLSQEEIQKQLEELEKLRK